LITRAYAKTILFVTHDLDEAVLIADRIVVMKMAACRRSWRCRSNVRALILAWRGTPEFAETRYRSGARYTIRNGTLMFDIANRQEKAAPAPQAQSAERMPLPRWVITLASIAILLILWEIFGRRINPVFGSYPSAIAVAFWELAVSGQLWSALYESLRPFLLGYALAILIGVPLGLLIGGFRVAEAALGIYVTAGYAMPLWLAVFGLWGGLCFAVPVSVVFLMALFPICINTWLGVVAVPKTLIEVGKSFVAPDLVILRRIVLPATLPYIMAGVRLAVGRAVVAMVIAEFFTTISGLGAVIINSANNFDTATMFVPIIILMLMAVGLNWLIGWVERRVAPWQAEIAGRDRE
jgi:NitT/TauT family transport system permease protein